MSNMFTPVKPDDNSGTEATPDNKPPPQPSLAEAYFFLNILKFNKSKLDTDWDKVAEASGFKNADTAKTRFGQVKKKLGFQNATPVAARVKPGKRGADADDASGPAEKKPRKTPAKPRGKKQPTSASSAAASSPTIAIDDDESPLAAKSKMYRNTSPIPSGLNDGNSYAVSKSGAKGIIKPEPEQSDSEEDEAKQNAYHKAELFKQITQEQIRSERETTTEPQQTQHGEAQFYDNRHFGPPNNFPVVNMSAPDLNAQQVKATAAKGRTPLPTSARQVRDAAGQQAMAVNAAQQARGHATAASTASLRQAHGGGGQAAAAHPAAAGARGGQRVAQTIEITADVDVEEDMTVNNAFNEAMYGTATANGSIFNWPTY